MDPLFEVLVQNSSDAIAMLNADGTVRFASESSARLLGYSLDERQGRSAFELLHPEDVARTREEFAELLAHPGTPRPAEYRMRHKDGSWRYIEGIAVNRLDEPAIKAIVVNYRDITDRRRAEDALRASEERLRHIVEHAQDLIYYCDANGRFTYVNPTAARVMRYEERELIGRHFLTLVRTDYQRAAADVYQRQLAAQTPTTYFEFPCITKGGGSVWVGQHVQLVYESGRVSGVHAIARDISRQKAAEEQLRKSEARYRSLIQGAAYGIYRTTVDGTILDANPALATMLGYASTDELRAVNMAMIYKAAADREALIADYRSQERETLSTDVTWKRKDGTPIIVRVTARVVDFEDGLRCFEGIAEDITEKRALEEQLRQALKMEAVGRLARGVAHDFNNVLAAILGCSDLLAMRLPPGDPARDDADEIRKAAERGASLTRQLLAFSRSQTLEAKVLDLTQVVQQLGSMLQRLAGDRVQVRIHVFGNPHVRMEPGQLEQVLLNLVVNARDAMPEGGTIDVESGPIGLDERGVLHYSGIEPGEYARIAVRDSGGGIDPELQPHIFEPFVTTKGPSKGTGLGLSIVYGIVKEAGGTVAYTTSPDRGTTFEVLVPLVEAEGQEPVMKLGR
jgi:two-component system cell cycle sensor histidine kinase/response regulator CckA